jgi:Flp pilus assembly protein TadG
MTRSKSVRSFLRASDGIAAIEMCFIFPLMLFLYFGLLDLTGLITHSRKITTVASAIADMVSQNKTAVVKSDLEDYFKIASLVMKPNPDTNVRIRVHVYRMVSGTPTKMWTVENGKGANCSADPSVDNMASLMSTGSDLIVTQACTKFHPYTGELMGHVILGSLEPKVEQMLTMSPRSSKTLTCYTTSALTTLC